MVPAQNNQSLVRRLVKVSGVLTDFAGKPFRLESRETLASNGLVHEEALANEMAALNGQPEDTSYVLKHIDEIGGPKSYNHFPVGWAWAMNTPFQWGKQVASHFGGTRNPLVVSWPQRIKDVGTVRGQFHHVIDVVPTLLEAAGVPEPVEVNGVWQKPIEGVSMMYSFDGAKAKSARETQYFSDAFEPGPSRARWVERMG